MPKAANNIEGKSRRERSGTSRGRSKARPGARNERKRADSSDPEFVPQRRRRCGQYRRNLNRSKTTSRGMLSTIKYDHYFRNIWEGISEERRNSFEYLDCQWFSLYVSKKSKTAMLKSVKRDNIFGKRYILVPIIYGFHWNLLIFCHLGESLQSKERTPCILLLDSLHVLDPWQLEPLIRRLVVDLYEAADRPEDKELVRKIPLLVPKVPQQRNGEECGFFMLFYMNLFLENAPQSFSVCDGYPYFLKEDWFTNEDVECFYERLDSFPVVPLDCPLSDSGDSNGFICLGTSYSESDMEDVERLPSPPTTKSDMEGIVPDSLPPRPNKRRIGRPPCSTSRRTTGRRRRQKT